MFCKECGNELKEQAIICLGCGVAVDNPKIQTNQPGKGVPIFSLIIGIIGIIFLGEPDWDEDTVIGCIMLWSLPPIILGIISIIRKHQGKVMGIIGLILGIISFLGYIGILIEIYENGGGYIIENGGDYII